MKMIRKLLLMDRHTCPWWLAYSWDHRLRNLIHNPGEILGAYVKQGSSVLDVGCGMGFFSIAMARLVGDGGSVHALDIQPKMLEILMKRARRQGVDHRISPVLSDGRSIPVPGEVDFILAFWVLHEVEDQEGLLKGLFASLKGGGGLLLVEPRGHVPKERFNQELERCRDAGLVPTGRVKVKMSRAQLFTK